MSIGIVTASATEAANPALTNLIEMLGSFCPGLLCIFMVYSRRPPEIFKRKRENARKIEESVKIEMVLSARGNSPRSQTRCNRVRGEVCFLCDR